MPCFTHLCRQGWLYQNAYTTYPETIKSFFAVQCVTFPSLDTDAGDYGRFTGPALAALLANAGYRTACFHSGRFMYLGMDQVVRGRGYQTLEDAGDIGGARESSFGIDEHSTVRRLLRWIDDLPPDRPFFATYLPIAGHHPYDAPEGGPFPQDSEVNRYRNALHYADSALAQLWRGLKDRGLTTRTVLVILGDHGEAFGQHEGNYGHTLLIYDENVRVPFLIVAPGMIEGPRRFRRVVSLIDTGPTVLDLLGLPIPAGVQGQSLLEPRGRMALFCTDYSLGLVGLRDGRWKTSYELDSRRSQLFDVDADPGEHVDLAERFPERAAVYRAHLLAWCAGQKFRICGR
jgi:arylsulfatase A-like enzyme